MHQNITVTMATNSFSQKHRIVSTTTRPWYSNVLNITSTPYHNLLIFSNTVATTNLPPDKCHHSLSYHPSSGVGPSSLIDLQSLPVKRECCGTSSNWQGSDSVLREEREREREVRMYRPLSSHRGHCVPVLMFSFLRCVLAQGARCITLYWSRDLCPSVGGL